MQIDGDLDSIFKSAYKFCRLIRKKQSCHILDADRIRAHLFDLFCDVCPVFQGISVSQSIGKRYLRMGFFLISRLYGCLQVAHIVQTVENTDNINSVCDRLLNKIFYHVVGIRTVSEDILSAEKHLKFGVFKAVTEFAESFPRILFQKTEGSVESGAAPAFYGMITDLVHFINDGKHLFCTESCGDQGLMRVTQNSFHNFYRFFF